LLKYRADPNQKVPLQGAIYTTALHLLVDQYGKVSSKDHKQAVERAIKSLIKHGADVENRDSNGITAYECAETSGQHVFSVFQTAVGDGSSDKPVASPTMMTRARRSVGMKSQENNHTGNLPTCTGIIQNISATALEPSSSKTSPKIGPANSLQHYTSQQPQKDQMGGNSSTTGQRKRGHDGVQRRSKRLHSEIELDKCRGDAS
jgi:peptide subunit release factor 1 (eRF1)